MEQREMIEKVEHAESEMNQLYWALEDRWVASRVNTILAKLYDLKQILLDAKLKD